MFANESINGIIVAYMSGLKLAFAIAIALSGVTVPIALGAKWKTIKMKKGNEAPDA